MGTRPDPSANLAVGDRLPPPRAEQPPARVDPSGHGQAARDAHDDPFGDLRGAAPEARPEVHGQGRRRRDPGDAVDPAGGGATAASPTSGRTAGAGVDKPPARRRRRGTDKRKRKSPAKPGEPLAPSTLTRGSRRQPSNGDAPDDAHGVNGNLLPANTAAAPVATTDAERARLALREVQRKLDKTGPTKLVTLAGVQPISAMTRFIDGGRERFIEVVQLAVLNNDVAACQWWEVYRELPSYPRSIVSFDDVCAASGVAPRDLMLVVISTAMDFGQDVGNLVAAVMHPKVVSKLAESAERIEGPHADISLKDRHAFLQARGFLPSPKGATINVHASASAQAASAAAQEPSVPSFTETIDATAERKLVRP